MNLRAKTHIFFSKGVLQFKSPWKTHKILRQKWHSGALVAQLQHDAFNPASLRPLRNESHFLRQNFLLAAQRCANTCLPSQRNMVCLYKRVSRGCRWLHYSSAAGVESKNVCVLCIYTKTAEPKALLAAASWAAVYICVC